VSFEYLNTCKKCSKDLTSHKSAHGIDFIEPMPLGILTFVDTSVGSAAPAPSEAMEFDTGDMLVDSGEAEEESVSIGLDEAPEDLDEVSGDFGEEAVAVDFEADTSEDIAVDEVIEEMDIGLDLGEEAVEETGDEEAVSIGIEEPDVELEEPEAGEGVEISLDDLEEEPVAATETAAEDDSAGFEITDDSDPIASDSGFTLGLGEDLGEGGELDFSSDVGLDTTDEAALDEKLIDEADFTIEESADSLLGGAGKEAGEAEAGLAVEEGESEPEIELAIDKEEPQVEIAIEEPEEDTGSAIELAEEPAETAPAETGEDDFADIDLSLDDKDLFGEGTDESDEIDLGDLDLQIGDEDLP